MIVMLIFFVVILFHPCVLLVSPFVVFHALRPKAGTSWTAEGYFLVRGHSVCDTQYNTGGVFSCVTFENAYITCHQH